MATGYVCLDTPPAVPQGVYPRRGGYRPSGTCIVHTSEGFWTSGVAALTRTILIRADYGAYHRACDWDSIVKYYPWDWECWQDSETNNWAVGISAACKTSEWLSMPANIREGFLRNMAHMAADFVRFMAASYGVTVPIERITGAQARAGKPGFCAHGDSGIARSDPGANFDWATFFKYIKEDLGSISPQGETEDDMFTEHNEDQLSLTLEDAHRTRAVLDNIEEPLWAKVLRVNRYVKSKTSDTIYELVDGKLRGISGLEWELLGFPPYGLFDQEKIDAMPKVD